MASSGAENTGDAESNASFRTPAQLAIKVITVHILTTANYVYLNKLQRRNFQGWLPIIRITVFFFVPTLLAAEIATNLVRALIHFVRDEIEEEERSFRFFFSAALGMHASQSKSDDDGQGKDSSKNVSLLNISSSKCSRKTQPVDWTWGGKLILSIFTLSQGIGSIVMWARRLHKQTYSSIFGFDHRNGAMGIASTAISIETILILGLHSEWTIDQPLTPGHGITQWQRRLRATAFAFAALAVQEILVDIFEPSYWGYEPKYTSSGIALMGTKRAFEEASGIVSVVLFFFLVIFFVIFRREIADKFMAGTFFERYIRRKMTARTWYRVRILIHIVVILWIAVDIVLRFVFDTVEVAKHPPKLDNSYVMDFWWQDPVNDAFPVL